MKFVMLTLVLFAGSIAMGGPRSDGGGQGVVSPQGEVKLVEFLTAEEISSAAFLQANDVKNLIYETERYVSQLAYEDRQFFTCAISIFNRNTSRYPIFQRLIQNLNSTSVLQVQFQIPSYEQREDFYFHRLPLPVLASTSSRLSPQFQFGLAAFANNQIWVSARLYARMAELHRCGLQIHEALRVLNFSGDLRESLSNSEVELLTRYFLGLSEVSRDSRLQVQRALVKLSRFQPTSSDVYAQAQELDRRAALIHRQLPRLEGQQLEQATNEFWRLTSEAMKLRTAGTGRLLQNPTVQQYSQVGIADLILFQNLLTRPLDTNEKWDVLTLRKANGLTNSTDSR